MWQGAIHNRLLKVLRCLYVVDVWNKKVYAYVSFQRDHKTSAIWQQHDQH